MSFGRILSLFVRLFYILCFGEKWSDGFRTSSCKASIWTRLHQSRVIQMTTRAIPAQFRNQTHETLGFLSRLCSYWFLLHLITKTCKNSTVESFQYVSFSFAHSSQTEKPASPPAEEDSEEEPPAPTLVGGRSAVCHTEGCAVVADHSIRRKWLIKMRSSVNKVVSARAGVVHAFRQCLAP